MVGDIPLAVQHLLRLTLAFCADILLHNSRNLEYPWYMFWNSALTYFFHKDGSVTSHVVAAPQFPISFEQVDNDGKPSTTSQFPDFAMLHLVEDPQYTAGFFGEDESPPTMLVREALSRIRGPYRIDDTGAKIFLLVEVKGLPPLDVEVGGGYETLVIIARFQAWEQARLYFSRYPDPTVVYLFACVAERWCWTRILRGQIPQISPHKDGTYREPVPRNKRKGRLSGPFGRPNKKKYPGDLFTAGARPKRKAVEKNSRVDFYKDLSSEDDCTPPNSQVESSAETGDEAGLSNPDKSESEASGFDSTEPIAGPSRSSRSPSRPRTPDPPSGNGAPVWSTLIPWICKKADQERNELIRRMKSDFSQLFTKS